jgi:hypothetical protein
MTIKLKKENDSNHFLIHKYLDKVHNILAKSALKVSSPSEANDPFEFLPASEKSLTKQDIKRRFRTDEKKNYEAMKATGRIKNKKQYDSVFRGIKSKIIDNLQREFSDENILEFIKKMRTKMDESVRFVSFSSEYCSEQDQILLWSHYARSHRGIKLYFDVHNFLSASNLAPNSIQEVKYSARRPEIDFSQNLDSSYSQEQIRKTFVTKSIAWKYESEYRLILLPSICIEVEIENQKKISMISFPPSSLVRIDLGLYCDEKQKIFQELNANHFKHVELYQAKLSDNMYKLEYDRIN